MGEIVLFGKFNAVFALFSPKYSFLFAYLGICHTKYGKQKGDFVVDGKFTIEVGGQGKTTKQIANIPNAYILADDIEFPIGKKLPLWILGFLY